jgi:predicted permease
MSFRSRVRTWLRAFGGRASMENEMDAELRFHVEAFADDLMRQANDQKDGRLTSDEALRIAHLKFGALDHAKEECREALGVSMLENLMQDLRFAFRTMRRSPGFTAIAILSLGLGIGANTAIFTLINQLMLKSLPVRDPQSLLALGKQIDGGITDGLSGTIDMFPYEFYQRLQQNDEAFSALTAYASGGAMQVTVRGSGASAVTTAHAHLVAGNYFDVLGVAAHLGRTLEPADDNGGQSRPVAVISDHYWREKFSRDPKTIGQAIVVNGTPVTVVGVAAPGFFGERIEDSPTDVWLPLGLQPQVMASDTLLGPKGMFWLQIMGRAKSNVSRAQAQQWVTVQLRNYVAAREGDATPERKREIEGLSVEIVPAATGVSILRAQYQEPLRILMCVVAVVLLIACANLANFLMAKTLAREHEIATRLALGAGRWRVVRQMLTESLVLSMSGGMLGLLLAYWGTQALIAFVSQGASFTPIQASPDTRILAFSIGVSLLTGLLFGIGPALRVSRMAMESGLKSNARTAAGGGTSATRMVPRILIAAQVALSLGLLVGAGLFLRTLRNLESRNFGFERSDLLVGQVEAKIAGYKSESIMPLYRQILDRIGALPGVQSATISTSPPMSLGSWMCPVNVKGRENEPQDQNLSVLNGVTPGYFQTLGVGLDQGAFWKRATRRALKKSWC